MENNTTTNTVNAKSQKLFNLTLPHRASPLMQRIQAFAIKEQGAKLMDYLGSAVPDTEKLEFLDTLIAIVEQQDWNRLPPAPNGQATAPTTPAPSPNKTLTRPAAPAPKPEANGNGHNGNGHNGHELINPVILPKPEAPVIPLIAPKPAAGSKLAALVAELEAELEAERAKPPAVPAPTAEEIRLIVRAEMAAVLESIAKVLRE